MTTAELPELVVNTRAQKAGAAVIAFQPRSGTSGTGLVSVDNDLAELAMSPAGGHGAAATRLVGRLIAAIPA